jgi:hypothetical protein
MKFLVIGDSNFRDLFASHGEEIVKKTGSPVSFEYATSVVSIKTLMDDSVQVKEAEIIFLATPTNEIAQRGRNNTKSREGIIEAVINEFYELVNTFAQKNEQKMIVVCYPFLRQDPPWLDGKLPFYKEYLKKAHNVSYHNVHLGSDLEISSDQLKPDRIHLNKDGLKGLCEHLTKDLKIAEKELSPLAAESDDTMESPSTQTEFITPPSRGIRGARSLRKTPARNKRQNEESGADEVKSKKKRTGEAKIDTVLDKLDLFMRELREDRKTNEQRFVGLESVIKETKSEQEEMKKDIQKLKESDNCFAASVREDIDAMDNLNARDTVVIKKMATEVEIPTDKKELSTFIMSIGKDLLVQLMGDDKGMKYIAPLYVSNNRSQPKEGARKELPPFKIVFKLLNDAILFKEKAIAASKELNNKLYKAYIASQMNVGTRIRLLLMWGVVDHLKREKKEGWVSQSSPKPTLMVKQSGNIVKTYSFIEAMTSYGDKIERKILDEATRLANRFFYGQIEKIFIVLKD